MFLPRVRFSFTSHRIHELISILRLGSSSIRLCFRRRDLQTARSASNSSEFPECVEEVQRVLKLHGAMAHPRRRDEVARISGKTLWSLRQHLLDVIPGLKERFKLDINVIH